LRGDTLAARAAGATAPTAQKDALRQDLAEHLETLDKALAEVQAAADASMLEALAKVKPDVQAYQAGARALVEGALSGRADERIGQNFDAGFAKLEESLGQLSALVEAAAVAANEAKTAMFARARAVLTVAVLLTGAAIALGALLFARTTLGRLGAEPAVLRDFAQQIADGQLGAQIAHPPRADSVAGAMLRMQGTLAAAVRQIRGNADAVATSSAQIASGNMDLSTRTEQQASALQTTASTMEELGATVRNNADNAKQANQLAMGASAVASKGGDVVAEVVETMKGINDSSKEIVDIIGVIDSIAFQTNILALNAAVEAARAGEQGRGFAVVASEVRSLAQRSAAAAKEIKQLISASVDRVEQGTSLVDRAGATMEEIVTSIKRVTDIVGEIATASIEQSAAVTQAGNAIAQMDEGTQRNAALVEESAAAADSLKGQAQQLVAAVAVFKVSGDARESTAAERSAVHPSGANAKATATAPLAEPMPA
jgi:methyl-accepting chemotaxis protein